MAKTVGMGQRRQDKEWARWASLLGLFLLVGWGCTGKKTQPEVAPPQVSVAESMRVFKDPKILRDDLPLRPLLQGLRQNRDRLLARRRKSLRFGPRVVATSDYVAALNSVIGRLETSGKRALSGLSRDFELYEVRGREQWGKVLVTSYYDPVISGSLKPTARLSQPLYAVPEDLVVIQFDQYLELFPHWRKQVKAPHEQKSLGSVIRGRLDRQAKPLPKVRPYYSRGEIDAAKRPLSRSAKILAWVDPVDAFFLQIQGSGILKLPGGQFLRVGYAAQNGHPYVAIGKHLKHVISLERMSLQTIQAYLRTLPAEKMQEILNLNPSYVFFRPLDTRSITYFGTEVVAGRTIATDYRYFPKGVLAFLEFEKPLFQTGDTPTGWQKTSRLVIDQDTGGAIRGTHRLDLYWGEGREARRSAGVMKNPGRLYYLVPRPEFLKRLRETQKKRRR